MMTVRQIEIDHLPALHVERRLPHPVERVWRAVTEPAELAHWFVAEMPWTPALFEEFEAGGDIARVLRLEPPNSIEWTWSVERYTFDVTAEGDGSLLVFTHIFNPELGPDYQHAAGWEAYFDRLDAHLAGGYLSEEEAHEDMAERLARYRQEFAAATP